MTLEIWALVAGTKGRQTRLSAGVTKGRQMVDKTMAAPPVIPAKTRPLLVAGLPPGFLSNSLDR